MGHCSSTSKNGGRLADLLNPKSTHTKK